MKLLPKEEKINTLEVRPRCSYPEKDLRTASKLMGKVMVTIQSLRFASVESLVESRQSTMRDKDAMASELRPKTES